MKNSKPNCPLYIEKEKVTVETTNQNKLPSVQWRNKQNNSPVGYTGCVSEVGKRACKNSTTQPRGGSTDGRDWS